MNKWEIALSKVVRARYENGVFKPLEPVDLEDGEEVIISIEKDIRTLIRKYRGALGKASLEELLQLEEEAQAQ
jgi:predicted DNA-binding antitoxin AbrB/MazE fold protein